MFIGLPRNLSIKGVSVAIGSRVPVPVGYTSTVILLEYQEEFFTMMSL